METIQKVCLVFTIIGALNWGLIGFFDFNLVTALFQDSAITRIVYKIVIINKTFSILIFILNS